VTAIPLQSARFPEFDSAEKGFSAESKIEALTPFITLITLHRGDSRRRRARSDTSPAGRFTEYVGWAEDPTMKPLPWIQTMTGSLSLAVAPTTGSIPKTFPAKNNRVRERIKYGLANRQPGSLGNVRLRFRYRAWSAASCAERPGPHGQRYLPRTNWVLTVRAGSLRTILCAPGSVTRLPAFLTSGLSLRDAYLSAGRPPTSSARIPWAASRMCPVLLLA